MASNQQLLELLKQGPVAAYVIVSQTLNNTPSAAERRQFLFQFTHFLSLYIPDNELPNFLSTICFGLDYESKLNEISESAVPTVCGKILTVDEVVYSCEQCQVDELCCQCADCFARSDHTGHNVRMSYSGGGTCDCGDPEAWNPSGFCSAHRGLEGTDPSESLPQDIKETVSAVGAAIFSIIAKAIGELENYRLAIAEAFNGDKAKLSGPCAVYHLKPGKQQGGRITFVGTQQECEERAKQDQQFKVLTNFVAIFDSTIDTLLSWVETIGQVHPGLNRVLGLSAITPVEPAAATTDPNHRLAKSSLSHIMDATRWNGKGLVGRALYSTFFELIKDPEFKAQFAVHFLNCYQSLLRDFALGPKFWDESLLRYSVQLFTLPNLTVQLAKSNRLIEIVFDSFNHMITLNSPTTNIPLAIENNKFSRKGYLLESGKLEMALQDLHYIMSLPAIVDLILESPSRVDFLIRLFELSQNMDPQTRIVTAQVIYQTNDWTRVMDFNDSLYELISLLLKQISAHLAAGDRRSFDLVFGKVYDRLLAFLTSEEARMKLVQIDTPGGNTSAFFVNTEDTFSFNLLLHRLFTQLVIAFAKSPLCRSLDDLRSLFYRPQAESQLNCPKSCIPLALAEHPLRLIAVISQARAGMWVRNGEVLIDQLNYYIGKRQHFFACDLATIQLAAAVSENISTFITWLKAHYKTEEWLDPEYTRRDTTQEADSDFCKERNVLTEDLLNLIIWLVSERYGVSQISSEDLMKRDALHILWLGKTTVSMLKDALPSDITDSQLEDIVRTTCRVIKATATKSGGVELNPQLQDKFEPFYPFYQTHEREKAAELYREYRARVAKNLNVPPNDPRAHAPPVTPPPLLPVFSPLIGLLDSPLLHQIVFTVCLRSCNQQLVSSHKVTLLQLRQSLHLIQLALILRPPDEKLSTQFFSLIDTSFESSGVTLLSLIIKLSETNCAASWILQQLEQRGTPELVSVIRDATSAIKPADTASSAEEKAKRLAAARAKVLAEMAKRKQTFEAKYKSELENISSSTIEKAPQQPIKPTETQQTAETDDVCIVCMDSFDNSPDNSWGYIAVVSRTTMPCITDLEPAKRLQFLINYSHCMEQSHRAQLCGHKIHFDCYDKYVMANADQYGGHVYFACPLCKNISNALLPSTSLHSKIEQHVPEAVAPPTVQHLLDNYVQSHQKQTPWWGVDTTPQETTSSTENEITPYSLRSCLEAFATRVACFSDGVDAPLNSNPEALSSYLSQVCAGEIAGIEIEWRSGQPSNSNPTKLSHQISLIAAACLYFQKYCRTTDIPYFRNSWYKIGSSSHHLDENVGGMFNQTSPLLLHNIFRVFCHHTLITIPNDRMTTSVDVTDLRCITAVMALAQFVQTVLYSQVVGLQTAVDVCEELPPQSIQLASEVLRLGAQLMDRTEKSNMAIDVDAKQAAYVAIAQTHVFLKRVVLLYAALIGEDLPLNDQPSEGLVVKCEWLLSRLGIHGGLSSLLQPSSSAMYLINNWMLQIESFPQAAAEEKVTPTRVSPLSEWQYVSWTDKLASLALNLPRPFELAPLPNEYNVLLRKYNKLTCPNCQGTKKLAIDLLTGEAICMRCLQYVEDETKVSPVSFYDNGVYLMLHLVFVMGTRSGHSYLLPGLYLDAFGEEDISMVRGRPLYLDQERVKLITSMVFNCQVGLSNSKLLVRW